MLYARVERTKDGFLADATAYVEELPTLAPSLPLGARSFATDPGHYDFHSRRFIKNLKPERLTSGETDSVNCLELRLRHNCWPHEEDLIIRYHDVRSVSFNAPRDDLDVAALHEVFLDEILPTETGCTHEIACLGGSLLISCADLVATWVDADCSAR